MDVQLKEFLDKIKAEGVEAGQNEAAALRQKAEAEAKALVDQAKAQAKAELENARAEIGRLEQAQKAALAQASRDLLLSLRQQVDRLFKTLLADAVGQALTPALAEKLILQLAASLKASTLEVQVAPAQAAELEKALKASLAAQLKGGLTVQPNPRLAKGFRVAEGKDGAYFDWSAEALAEVLAASVSPALGELLKNAAKA